MRIYSVLFLCLGLPLIAAAEATPEEERSALIQVLQKRLPGTSPSDWVLGTGSIAREIQAIPLNADNATNSADILAIGKKRWERKFANGKSLAACFPNGGKRVATTYPQFDTKLKQVVTFEMAINRCLALHGEPEIGMNDVATLGPLAAYARSLSSGQKLTIRVATQPARDKYAAGKRLFHQRIGRQNFACASCHIQYAGTVYTQEGRSYNLSPAIGQAANWPRLEPGGQVRTLQRQFQRCMQKSGAAPFGLGSAEFNNLEYYLTFLSNGLPLNVLSNVR
ncbi:MAG: sulfur oxidation c-type cytochrome SoxA [Betaproteobacteria bacterium]|nr:sulfur oxidation c-type cytochrome SoxA [Betaproteobacteria bacterium]